MPAELTNKWQLYFFVPFAQSAGRLAPNFLLNPINFVCCYLYD